jgi:hypothetical protein
VAVTASTPEGEPSFADATLTLPKPLITGRVGRCAEDPLVVPASPNWPPAQLLEQARAAADAGDWNTVERMLAEARQRFADSFPG